MTQRKPAADRSAHPPKSTSPKAPRASKPDDRRRSEPAGTDSAPRATPDGGDALQGEGNYTAARRYNTETADFAKSGRVEQAARDAAPDSAEEARSLERAEDEGRSRAREEDPTVARAPRR